MAKVKETKEVVKKITDLPKEQVISHAKCVRGGIHFGNYIKEGTMFYDEQLIRQFMPAPGVEDYPESVKLEVYYK